MKTRLLVLLGVVAAAVCVDARADENANRVIDLYQAGIAAADSGDNVTYGEKMKAALALAPGHPALFRHVARALASQGQGDEAVAWLRRVAATGVDLDIESDEYFASLHGRDDFQEVVASVAAHRLPHGDMSEAFRLDLDDYLPEGIAYDSIDDVFYLGSIRYGKIVRISRSGRVTDLVAPDDTGGVIGIRVDPSSHRLWAVASHQRGLVYFDEEREGESTVFCVDLDGGVVERRWFLPKDDADHALNDIVVARDGRVYATDANSGALYTIAPGGELEQFLPPQSIHGCNGLALSDDGKLLYVSQYGIDIVVVDLERQTVAPLGNPAEVALCGVDGLYFHRGTLVAVQNYLGMQQVSQFVLDATGRAVVSERVLGRQHPRFADPTTGAFVGDDFYVVANSQISTAVAGDGAPPPDTFDDTFIVKVLVE